MQGTLRGARVSTFGVPRGNETAPLSINLPFAYSIAGSPEIFLELFFHDSDTSITEQCGQSKRTKLIVGETLDVSKKKSLEKDHCCMTEAGICLIRLRTWCMARMEP